jgi:P4 family phage/plasmid primase-like protien
VKDLPPKMIEMCKVKDFVANKLDTKINLLAFENGVYDLDQGEFRKIEATDYISLNTGYDYNDKVDKEIVQEVRDLLKSLFLTDEMHDYILNVLSSVLYGQNKFQEFYIFTGRGANGKSILQKLMAKSLGHYAKKVNTTTFTKSNAKQNETSELHNAKGIRNVYCEEPKDTDKFISSRLKEYSGDNRICTRGLYKDPIEWDIQFTMIFAGNDIPDLDGCDDDSRAMGRRLRIIDFPMSFIEDPDNPKPDQIHLPNKRKMDVNLGKRVDTDVRYRQAFIKILVENWAKMKHLEALNTPEEVMVASKKYIEESNPVLMFMNNYYIYNTDAVKDKKIKSSVIYTKFLNSTGILKKDFSIQRFGRKLTALGIKPDDRNEYRLNIMQKPDEDVED